MERLGVGTGARCVASHWPRAPVGRPLPLFQPAVAIIRGQIQARSTAEERPELHRTTARIGQRIALQGVYRVPIITAPETRDRQHVLSRTPRSRRPGENRSPKAQATCRSRRPKASSATSGCRFRVCRPLTSAVPCPRAKPGQPDGSGMRCLPLSLPPGLARIAGRQADLGPLGRLPTNLPKANRGRRGRSARSPILDLPQPEATALLKRDPQVLVFQHRVRCPSGRGLPSLKPRIGQAKRRIG